MVMIQKLFRLDECGLGTTLFRENRVRRSLSDGLRPRLARITRMTHPFSSIHFVA